MRTQSAAPQDPAAGVTPAIRPRSPWRASGVEALPGYRLRVTFLDGSSGTVDMSRIVQDAKGGVFRELADPALFQRAGIELGAVVWPTGQDLAPDAMYKAIRASGTWRL